jgi:uncharacterized protein (TIGR02271 family)
MRQDALQWKGSTVVSQDGDKIGTMDEIYLDRDTGEPEFGLVNTGLLGTSKSFVPLAEASERSGDVAVPYSKDQVKNAPRLAADAELSQSEEAELYSYYGMSYSEAASDSGLPQGRTGTTGRDTAGPTTDDAMTRSEEELRIGKTQREAGRARLRKHVVTENVTQTVPVTREEVRVEREPITDANVDRATSGPELSDDDHEVVLTEEEVVAEKRVVPKERVRLSKEAVTDEAQVNEEVRKEQIEEDTKAR